MIAAYKQPAYLLLVSHHQSTTTTNPLPGLCALVAYYPKPHDNIGRYTNPTPCEPPSSPIDGISTYSSHTLLPLQVHLAAHQSPAMYDNYFLNTNKKRHRCYVFSYPESQIGFAEHAEPTYDHIDAQLAWSRALDCVKRGFSPGASWSMSDIEAVWTEYWQHLTKTSAVDGHAEDSMDMMVGGLDDGEDHRGHDDHEGGPSVNCIPTMVKGTYLPTRPRIKMTTNKPGTNSTFPKTTFFPTGPQSQHIRLLTRTIGPDRIVDEVLLTFTHTDEIPWLLPGVPPTNRHVQIPLVLTGSFCAGKLARQNVYWDQASVLVQVGLLDPGLVPEGFATAMAKGGGGKGGVGVERMPACGREEVQVVLDV